MRAGLATVVAMGLCACGQQADAAQVPDPVGAPAPARVAPAEPEVDQPEVAEPDGEAAAEPPPGLGPLPELPPFLGQVVSQDHTLEVMRTGAARELKPVGTTSVVFRVKLRGDETRFAYKPASLQHEVGWRAEIAAYRISRLLRMETVPPVISRRMPMNEVEAKLHPDFVGSWDEIHRWTIWDHDQTTIGAAIYWIPRMRDYDLEREVVRRRHMRWLAQDGTIPEGKERLASDLSTMVLFDYLIANWDRYSGSNAQGLPDGSRLFVRDHNAAFGSPLHPDVHQRVLEPLVATERFSRTTVEGLRRMDRRAILAELAEDPAAIEGPILTDAQLADVLERRETALSHVGALVDEHGEEAVLVFP